MKYIVIAFSLVIAQASFAQKTTRLRLKKGEWLASLQLTEQDRLPFNLLVEKKGKDIQMIVMNGDERIVLEKPVFKDNQYHVRFPYFNSEIVFSEITKSNITGYWQNFNKGDHYTIPFEAAKSKDFRFDVATEKMENLDVSGKWEVAFEPNTDSEYPAVGIFNQKGQTVTGTFLTETGDYRYLAGNTVNDSLYLSCFDGSHAFLFKAKKEGDTLHGQFFSGSHWQSDWQGVVNEKFELPSPEALTYLKEGETVHFELPTLTGSDFKFPNAATKDKVVIIQIMGTWCPNCLDETMYYKSLQEKYKDQGLEIISVCYEAGESIEEYVRNIERLKQKLSLDFTFLVGGSAQKSLASQHFNMLNSIISFPTSIFIGRDGEVKRVHTGFNGPGTGTYYTDYVKSTNALIEYLLAQ